MSPSDPVPPEVLAIAVALAVAQARRQPQVVAPVTTGEAGDPAAWRWDGRRWERPGGYRWS
jgi:hypothetical protein